MEKISFKDQERIKQLSNNRHCFAIICRNNKDLNVFNQEDATKFLQLREAQQKDKVVSFLGLSAISGFLFHRFLPGQRSPFRNLGVGFLALAFSGLTVVSSLDSPKAKNNTEINEIMNKYSGWTTSPKVVDFLKKRTF